MLEESFPLHPWPKDQMPPPGRIFFDGAEQLIIKVPGGEILYRDLASGQKEFKFLGYALNDDVLTGYGEQRIKVRCRGLGAFRLQSSRIMGGNSCAVRPRT